MMSEGRHRFMKDDADSLPPIILFNFMQFEIVPFISSNSHLFPLINLEGPQLELSRLVSKMKFETREDYEKYFSRLEAFPTQVHVQGIGCSEIQVVV